MPEYNVDGSEVRKSFQQIGALAFVHLGDVEESWQLLKPTLPSSMDSFAEYYERTWVGTSSSPPLFSPWMWNQHDTVMSGLPRSSNIAEGWHNGFRSLLGCSNPTIWRFIDVLKKEQDLTDWKIAQKLMRSPAPPRQKKWIDFDRRLNNIIAAYDDYDRLDFLKCVGYMVVA